MERGDLGSGDTDPAVSTQGRLGRRLGVVSGGTGLLLLTATVAHAESATGSADSAAAATPAFFGLGMVGLGWLLVGSLSLVVGLVLATRRVSGLSPDRIDRTTMHASTSIDQSGGAKK